MLYLNCVLAVLWMIVFRAALPGGAMCGSRGGTGSPDPPSLKNHKNIGSLSNTGPDPLKITKLPSQHSRLGHHRHASETQSKWRFAGGPMMAHLFRFYLPSLAKITLKLDPL